ncbi:MAG: tetratricopeptide repeat protein [Anaerolineales bacterium]|nr:tetratricopeptide repeat protein [Anaerolineales bacterium]
MEKLELQRLNTLKNIFPEESWSWAIPALRRNSLIWEDIGSPDFAQVLVQDIGTDPSDWTPGRIGALQLARDESETIPFPILSFDALSAEVKGKVHQTYQAYEENQERPINMIEGVLLALALLGEKNTGKSWREIISQYAERVGWHIPLVILFGLIEDPIEYLRVLDPELALQVLLSNPINSDSLVGFLVRITQTLEIGELEKWFKAIQKEVPDLVSNIAQALLSSLNLDSGSMQETLVLSLLNQLSGNNEKALKLLEKASDQNQKIQGKLTANLNKVRSHLDEPQVSDKAWQDLKGSLSNEDGMADNLEEVAEIIHSLLAKNQVAAVGDLISKLPDPLPDHAELSLALAAYALAQNQPIRAEQLALTALELSRGNPLENLGTVLLNLGLNQESARAAERYLEKYPNHLNSHLTNIEALRRQGNYTDAAKAAQILTIYYPHDINLQRKLAGYLEEAEAWQEALEVRATLLTKLQSDNEITSSSKSQLPIEDLISFASCAYSAGHHKRAVSACNQILAQSQENSAVLALKGKALFELDQVEEGFAHLNRAVELTPEKDESWLTLAECEVKAGKIDQARQTLKSGLTAADNQAWIYYHLAKIESQNGNQSKALETFQKSAANAEIENLNQKQIFEIQLGMSNSYYKLGHHDQARKLLKELNERFPANLGANYLYGKLLLDMNEPEGALPYLIQAVDQAPDVTEINLSYADALLQTGSNPQTAAAALKQALKLEPDNMIALALLGEAQAAEGNFRDSVFSFQKAGKSGLMVDPCWSPRISMGLGNSALKLGETETAIVSLKDAHDRFPSDLKLTRCLAEAYQAANLTSNALETAKTAAEIAPQDSDNLSWVAAFTLDLGSPEQGIAALKKLIRINPDQANAYIHLGKAQASAGNLKEASAAFAMLTNFEDVQPEDLLLAGDELIKLGDLEVGMQCLKRAINICEANPIPSPLLPKIWSCQAVGFEVLEDHQNALTLLDKAISAELDNPEWRIQKADLLIKGDRYQAAIASLSNALDLSPDEPALHTKMARVQRQIGAYEEAFYHAQEALSGKGNDPDVSEDEILILAADLACSTLRTKAAEELLSNLKTEKISENNPLNEEKIISLCLAAELALDQTEEVKAAELSNLLVSSQADHPRVSALQARILNRQGSLVEAQSTYNNAIEKWHNSPVEERHYKTAMEIALGKTALEIHFWDDAATHLQHAVDISPTEKRALFELASGYIKLAENSRFFEAFKVINSAPSQISTSADVYQSLQGCINALSELGVDPAVAGRLKARGNAVFTPSQETADALKELAETPEDLAAVIAAYRHSRQKVYASQVALDNLNRLGEDPRLDAQISLALLRIKPDEAFKAASSALDSAKRIYQTQVPLYFVGLALAAKGVHDPITARESMGKALKIWDDEPRWYALAAEMTSDYAEAVAYYEQAIKLEPEYIGHYLALGKKQLDAKQALSAVKSFDKAIALNPEHVDSWIQRALGKRAIHRMPEALVSINQAMALAPEHKEARKTAALLTFENGNYRESEKHLVALLGQEPNDTDLLALFARTLAAQKQNEQALRVINNAITLDEESLDLKLQRASMIKHIEGPLAAIDELRIIGSHYPDQYPLVIELVATLAEAGEMDQAIRTAMDVLQNEEIGYTREQKSHLYLTTGRLLRNTGHLDQAVHHLFKAKKLVDPNYEAVLELGRVHHDRRQYNLALEQIQNAIDIEPNEAEGYYQAGRVLKDLKQYNQAEKMLRKASQLAPNDLKIHRQLGVLVTLNLVHGESRKEVLV